MAKNEAKQETSDEVTKRIEGSRWYSYLAKIGFLVILIAFLSALFGVLPSNLDSVSSAVNAILLPLIFVGIGFLLLGIAMHLHLLHLNLIHQIQKNMGEGDQSDDNMKQ